MWEGQRLKLWTFLSSWLVHWGARNIVVSEQMKPGWHAISQNSSHHHPWKLTFRHTCRLTKLLFEKCFKWLRAVRSLATEHCILQLEVETKALLYRPAWNHANTSHHFGKTLTLSTLFKRQTLKKVSIQRSNSLCAVKHSYTKHELLCSMGFTRRPFVWRSVHPTGP